MRIKLTFLFLMIVMILSACSNMTSSFGNGSVNTPSEDREKKLRGEYFDFAVKYRLDYVPFFSEGSTPSDSKEYLYYAFSLNLEGWGDNKGTMTREYVEKIIRSYFVVGEINHKPLPLRWNFDGEIYTAVPTGINDQPIYVLKKLDSTVESGRTVYTITMDYCSTKEYPLNNEQRQQIRASIIDGDYSLMIAIQTESFRYYMDEKTNNPVFLSHKLESSVSNGVNDVSKDGSINAQIYDWTVLKLTDPKVLKYYNYFKDNHTLVDNRIFTVNENTLQDDVIYFAFMNTQPMDKEKSNIRTKKQIDDVLMKYFGIKPKRYITGSSSVTENGDVQLGNVVDSVVRMNRLLLKKVADNGKGSYSAVFKLYQINTERALPDFDRRILEGDLIMEMYYTMDLMATFTEIPEGESYYLKFSEFTLKPREGNFTPPPQETDYIKRVSRDELKSFHGLYIGMTLFEAKKILNLPEGAYEHQTENYADSTSVNVDGWTYTFRTIPKESSNDKTQYLISMNIREYLGIIFRGIKLGDAYVDVIKKFPQVKEDGQILGAVDSYFIRDYEFASTLRSVDIFIGDIHIHMLFGRYDTLAWMDIYLLN